MEPRHIHTTEACQPATEILARVGDKWSMLVVMLLNQGPKRFNQLKRETGTISQRMLTLTLRGLERDGLVTRTIFPTVPPRVDYELTDLGRSLEEPVRMLGQWATVNRPDILMARAKFDAATGAASTDNLLRLKA